MQSANMSCSHGASARYYVAIKYTFNTLLDVFFFKNQTKTSAKQVFNNLLATWNSTYMIYIFLQGDSHCCEMKF